MISAIRNWYHGRKLLTEIRRHSNWRKVLAEHSAKYGELPPTVLAAVGNKVYRFYLDKFLQDSKISFAELSMLEDIDSSFHIETEVAKKIRQKFGLKFVDKLAQIIVRDGIISAEEKIRIDDLAAVLYIPEKVLQETIRRHAASVYLEQLNGSLKDRRLTEDEEAQLSQLMGSLGLSADDVKLSKRREQELSYFRLLAEIEQGNLPRISSPVSLAKNEICHFAASASRRESSTVHTGFTGGSAGMSLRLMKGLTVRTSSFRGRPVMKSVTTQYPGTLIVTNKKVMFSANNMGFTIPYTKLDGIMPYSDGLGLQNGASTIIIKVDQAELAGMILAAAAIA